MNKVRKNEEILLRGAELTGEEFRLYALIYNNTASDTKQCKKDLTQISERYRLDLEMTTLRYQNLTKKGWVESTGQGIRPLVGVA